jgi:5'-nucleotidase
MNIYGNKMIFDTEGVVIDFHQPIIHSYSKALVNCDHLKTKLKDRCNVVLIGDSQGDPEMSKGLDYIENIIKIGFLNHHENDLLPIYEKLYDIVLIGPDNTLELPYLLLTTILEH